MTPFARYLSGKLRRLCGACAKRLVEHAAARTLIRVPVGITIDVGRLLSVLRLRRRSVLGVGVLRLGVLRLGVSGLHILRLRVLLAVVLIGVGRARQLPV